MEKVKQAKWKGRPQQRLSRKEMLDEDEFELHVLSAASLTQRRTTISFLCARVTFVLDTSDADETSKYTCGRKGIV